MGGRHVAVDAPDFDTQSVGGIPLAAPLTDRQIASAVLLHDQLGGWNATDKALALVAARFPEIDYEATLIKVATVNQLYGTNLYAVHRMAAHLADTLSQTNLAQRGDSLADAVLVEHLANLPRAPGQQQPRRHISFASKFAHFFIDLDRFPIYDSHAVQTVAYHLGSHGRVVDRVHPYQAFVLNLNALKERAALTCTWMELDRYLWLAGQLRAWNSNKTAHVNAEVPALFANPSPTTEAELTILASGSQPHPYPDSVCPEHQSGGIIDHRPV